MYIRKVMDLRSKFKFEVDVYFLKVGILKDLICLLKIVNYI